MAQTTLGVLNETTRREIRAALARQEVSQRQLADRLGWSVSYIRHRLNGPVGLSLNDVEAIASTLGVPIERLITAPAAV